MRLTLQLIARYAAWISSGMEQRAKAAAAAAAAGGQPPAGGDQAGAAASASAAANGQTSDGTGTAAAASWEAAATPEQLAALRRDVDVLLSSLLSTFVPQLSALLAELPPEAAEATASAFSEGAERLEAAGAAVMGAVAESLTEKSVVVLKQVGGGWLAGWLGLAGSCLPLHLPLPLCPTTISLLPTCRAPHTGPHPPLYRPPARLPACLPPPGTSCLPARLPCSCEASWRPSA